MVRIGTYHNGHSKEIIDKLNKVLDGVSDNTIVEELFINYFDDQDIEEITQFFSDRLKEE